jgi:3-dehydroquinate synthase
VLVVVADARVLALHAMDLAARLRSRDLSVHVVEVPEGEAAKTREAKAALEDRLLDLGAGADSTLLAVGGGAVGDLVGFTAATWHRGIPVVQVPTTLLAMADAALGGKTAVNLPGAKNLLGSFHEPWGVFADVSVLATLAESDFVGGFAEVVKSAAVADVAFFRWLERSGQGLVARESDLLEHAVARALRIKARIVRRDLRDGGRRAVLNFGHTVGHALEAASGYTIRHGPAVSIGMSVEALVAQGETGFPEHHAQRLAALLLRLGLPVRPPDLPPDAALIAAARHDKKNREGRIHCALPLALGRMPRGHRPTLAVDETRLLDALARGRAAS